MHITCSDIAIDHLCFMHGCWVMASACRACGSIPNATGVIDAFDNLKALTDSFTVDGPPVAPSDRTPFEGG
jgi:hypothetical protein